MDPIQRYTDLAYGTAILVGTVLLTIEGAIFGLGQSMFGLGLGVGIYVGFAIHVGSQMIAYDKMTKSVEKVEETVDDVKESVESVEGKAEETIEKVEETTDTVSETKEKVESVEEKTEHVEQAMNGNE